MRKNKWKKISETMYERTQTENIQIEQIFVDRKWTGEYKINHQFWRGRCWMRNVGNHGTFKSIKEAQKYIEQKFEMEKN